MKKKQASVDSVNRKRVQRLLRLIGLEGVRPKRRTSGQVSPQRRPYLLAGLTLERPNHVWACDITYVPMRRGFLYMVVVLDWWSRYVVAWEVSNTQDTPLCLDALNNALRVGCPEILNTDQGPQFTSQAFLERLEKASIRVSHDGKGRCFDNIFIERFWRTLKYEELYLKDYPNVPVLLEGLKAYIDFYNHARPHQALGYRTPAQLYFQNDFKAVNQSPAIVV